MAASKLEAVLAALRARAAERQPSLSASPTESALAHALHELDVHQAELEIQNEDLRATQVELTRARDGYRLLFEEAPVPILSLSTAGVVLAANRAALELVERPAAALLDRPFAVCLAERESDAFFHHLRAVAESRVPQRAELVLRARSGTQRRVVLWTAYVLAQSRGAAEPGADVLLAHLADVTAQRAAEAARTQLERRLRESEKLEAVGRVAGTIAHDVNHILALVITLADFLKTQVSDHPQLAHEVEVMLDACWRGARLMRGLLGLSTAVTAVPRTFNLAAVVLRVAALLKHAKAGVEVKADVAPLPVPVLGDEEAILHALLSVASNAVEATTEGAVTVECHAAVDHGGIARVVVRDRGTGMAPGTLARAFEPLFTTRASAGAAGLGLSLAHKAITGHRGSIEIESAPGHGTTVSIELPVAPSGAGAPGPSSRAAAAGALRGRRVLLVDEDPPLRRALRRQLEGLGAEVADFGDGEGARRAVVAGPAFDVTVIDAEMPGGGELAPRLYLDAGPLPTVILTRTGVVAAPAALLTRDHVRVLCKPCAPRDLVEAIEGVIAAPSLAATAAAIEVDADDPRSPASDAESR